MITKETTWTVRLLKTDIPHVVRGVVYTGCEKGQFCEIDSQGDWIRPDELRKAAWDFMRKSFMKKGRTIGNQHKEDAEATVVESYITPVDMEVEGELWKAGSWVVSVKVDDESLWQRVESGELNAFSLGGKGLRIESTPS